MKHPASSILSALFGFQLFFSFFTATQAAETTIIGQVTARPAISFQITVPASGTAGQPFGATITALDSDGLPTTNIGADVSLATTNGGTISPITISASQFTDDGAWEGSITLTRAGDDRTIQATSGSATGSATIDIVAGSLARVEVTPSSIIIAPGESGQFSASGFDRFQNVILGLDFVWSVVAGGGTINQSGLFTAGRTGGTYTDTVRATATEGQNSFSSTASVTITGGDFFNQVTDIIVNVRQTVARVRQQLKENPVVQQVTQTITPILGPIATTTAAITAITQLATAAPVLLSIGDAFLYTSYLWSVLLEFLGLKRRRRSWGVVYNAETKEPIPLVVVQLVDEETAHLIEQRVTDPYGRFGFLVKPGRYRIVPSHPHYQFPSKISPENGDLRYSDLYHGEEIAIEDPHTILALNIPLDPIARAVSERRPLLRRFSFRRISLGLLILSVILQGFGVFLEPTPRNIAVFAAYAAVLIVIAYILRRGHRSWGVVFDAETKQDLANAQIFVTQDENPRFASRKVTDIYGRFYLLLPRGTYRLAVQHPQYQFPVSEEIPGYKGEAISITPKNPLVHVDIPVVRRESPNNSPEPPLPLMKRVQ